MTATATAHEQTHGSPTSPPPVLLEQWLPARAIGVECNRERGNPIALPPQYFLHVWWARRPLSISRAAVLLSLLPPDFPRDAAERLLGLSGGAAHVVAAAEALEVARASGVSIESPFGPRAFSAPFRDDDLAAAQAAVEAQWGDSPIVLDPMAGGGQSRWRLRA